MPTLELIVKGGLYAVMFISIAAAIGVVVLRNLFHAALALVVTLLGIAGLYLALHAEFIAVVQVLLYVGAVMALVIFAIMLTERFGDKSIPAKNNLVFSAIIVTSAFAVVLVRVLTSTPWQTQPQTLAQPITTFDIGAALMGPYVLPFEVISVILVAALIGAIVIARKDRKA